MFIIRWHGVRQLDTALISLLTNNDHRQRYYVDTRSLTDRFSYRFSLPPPVPPLVVHASEKSLTTSLHDLFSSLLCCTRPLVKKLEVNIAKLRRVPVRCQHRVKRLTMCTGRKICITTTTTTTTATSSSTTTTTAVCNQVCCTDLEQIELATLS